MTDEHRAEFLATMPPENRESLIASLTEHERELLVRTVSMGDHPTLALARVTSGLAMGPVIGSGAPEGHKSLMDYLDQSEKFKIVEEWGRMEMDPTGTKT